MKNWDERERPSRPLRKRERIPGRHGFKVDELSGEAREKVLELMHKGVPYLKISKIVSEVYNEGISGAAICRYNRYTKEQFDLAADRTKKIREWSKAIVGAASENPDVDTSKLLTSLMEGDLLSYITSVDTQAQMADLPIDKINNMITKLGRVGVQREALLWKARVQKLFNALEAKAKKAEESVSPQNPANENIKERLSALLKEFGQEEIKKACFELGLIEKPRSSQGLDPQTLRTIREEIYGIIQPG